MASLGLMVAGHFAIVLSSVVALTASCSSTTDGVAGASSTGGSSGGQGYFPSSSGGASSSYTFEFDLPECTVEPPAGCEGWSTRYWDCCKPHCAWPANASYTSGTVRSCGVSNQTVADSMSSSCEGGPAHTCWNMAPWAVSDTLSYGFAATAPGNNCGRCYQLDFTGASQNDEWDQGSRGLCGKSMIVQVTNVGQDVDAGQFDILIPGGGVGAFNGCSTQWGATAEELGAQYGGFMTTCRVDILGIRQPLADYKACVQERCQAVFAARGLTELAAGCQWYVDWFHVSNNPALVYREVDCPAELTQRSGISSPGVADACL